MQYTTLHEGIRVDNCATVRVTYNSIAKSNPPPTNLPSPKNLRGVSVITSPTTIVAHNTLTRLGTGVYAWDQCPGSSLACNDFVNCFNGFFFDGPTGTANIGNQLIHPTQGTDAPTGNTWSGSINFDITGGISPTIFWYHDATTPPSIFLLTGSLFGPPGNTTTYSANPSGCDIPQFNTPAPAPLIEREQNAGEPVLNPNSFAVGTQQGYYGRAHAHRMLRGNPSWMILGSPQDSLYSNFYFSNDNSNVGLFRNFEDMAAVDSVQAAGSILSNIADTNISETNLKVVYSIYHQTWMRGVYEFSSGDSSTLYNIAVQNAADAGEAVFAARVMLGLIVDESSASSARYNIGQTEEQPHSFTLYPNPASDNVNGLILLEENQMAVVNIVDLQGKVISTQKLFVSRVFTIDVSGLESGLYFVQMLVDGEIIETSKLEVMHE